MPPANLSSTAPVAGPPPTGREIQPVLAVQLCGAAGTGKTALIAATARRLAGRARVAAVVAHRAAQRDADQLRGAVFRVVSLDAAYPQPAQVLAALHQIEPHRPDIAFIESPADEPWDLGDDLRVALFSVTGGDDKAVEFPDRVIRAAIVLLNKTDLLPLMKFDPRLFRGDVVRLNPSAELIELSCRNGTGMNRWTDWLLRKLEALRSDAAPTPSKPEWWFG